MEVKCERLFFFGIFVLCSLIKTSYSLKCYTCDVSTSQLDDDACKGKGYLNQCTGNSVCLAASYEVETGTVRTYTTMRTCSQAMAGQECDNFFKTQNDILHKKSSITPNTCYICEADNCNINLHQDKKSNGSIPKILSIFIYSILSLNLFWLMSF